MPPNYLIKIKHAFFNSGVLIFHFKKFSLIFIEILIILIFFVIEYLIFFIYLLLNFSILSFFVVMIFLSNFDHANLITMLLTYRIFLINRKENSSF